MKKIVISILILCFLLGLAWVVPMHPVSAQTAGTQVGIFKPYEVAPSAELTLPIEVKGARDLYGIDLLLEFDPALLQVKDADAQTPGVQMALGTFLDPGLLLFNEADNNTGTLRFAMAQVNPSEAKNGDGILLVVTFSGLKAGVSDLKVSKLEMSTREGLAIVGSPVDSQVTVKEGAAAQGQVNYPTQEVAGVITVPTLAPTTVPTVTPQPTPTPVPTEAPKPTATAEPAKPAATLQVVTAPVQKAEEQGLSATTVIAVVVGVILVAVAGFLLSQRKKGPQEEVKGENHEN